MRKPGTRKRRVEIKKIENKNARMVTFSKRRTGLFRKTNRLADLYGLDLAMVVFSPGGRAFTNGNLSLVDRYLDQVGAADHVPGGGDTVPVSSTAAAHVPPSLAPDAPTVPQASPVAAVHAVPMDVQAASSAVPGFNKKGLRGYMRRLGELRRRVVDRMNYLEGEEKAKSNEEMTNVEVRQDPAADDSEIPFRTFL